MNRKLVVGAVSSLWLLMGCGGGADPSVPGAAGSASASSSPDGKFKSRSKETTVSDIYNLIKQAEAAEGPPPYSGAVQMGSFNCATGEFIGNTSYTEIINTKPVHFPATAAAAARRAALTFTSVNCPSGFSVTVNNFTISNTTGAPLISTVSDASARWKTFKGTKYYQDTVALTYHPPKAIGAFRLTAMPIAIVYEPPPNLAHTNKQTVTFSSAQTMIHTVSSSASTDTSQKTFWLDSPGLYDAINNLAAIPGPQKIFLDTASTLWGSVTNTNTSGTSVNTDSTLSLTTTHQQSVGTAANLGPGRGDVFFFYVNPSIIWVDQGNTFDLSILDQGTEVAVTGAQLLSDLAILNSGVGRTVTHLDANTIQALLDMDPFVANPRGPTLPATRFIAEPEFILGSGLTFSNLFTQAGTSTVQGTYTNYTGTITDSTEGWLGYIGIGVTDNGTTTTKMSYSSSTSLSSTVMVTSQFDLATGPTESDDYDVAFDGVFSTFAVYAKPKGPCSYCAPLDGGVIAPNP